MGIKCIALDLDRTTLNAESRLSEKNKEALEQAIAKGIHIVIASGRGFSTLPKDVTAIRGIEYAITSNGAAIYHVPSGACMVEYSLPEDVASKVFELTEHIPYISYECSIHGKAYSARDYVEHPKKYRADETSVWYMKTTRTLVPDIKAFILEHADELDCMDVIVPDEEKNKQVTRILKQGVPDVYMTSSVYKLVELSNKRCGKKSGLQYIAEHLGLKREELAAFGDGNNDIDMLEYAGIGIAVENASKACSEAADHITKHHDEDGVAWGLREILKLV